MILNSFVLLDWALLVLYLFVKILEYFYAWFKSNKDVFIDKKNLLKNLLNL